MLSPSRKISYNITNTSHPGTLPQLYNNSMVCAEKSKLSSRIYEKLLSEGPFLTLFFGFGILLKASIKDYCSIQW